MSEIRQSPEDPKEAFNEAVNGIRMPEESKENIRKKTKALIAQETIQQNASKQGRRFPVRRVVLIAAAVLLVAALTVGLFVALRPSDPGPDPYTEESRENRVDTKTGNDWVKDIFKTEDSVENKEGTVKTPENAEGKDWSIGDLFGGKTAAADVKETAPMADEPEVADGYGRTDDVGEDVYYRYETSWSAAYEDGPTAVKPGAEMPDGYEYYEYRQQVQAGLLTAGRTDDNKQFEEFLQAMEELGAYASKWRIYPRKRLTVHVEGSNNAMVALSDREGNVLSYGRTDANGDAYLYYDIFTEQGQSVPYKVGVSNGQDFAEVELKEEDGDAVSLELAPAEVNALDIMIMLDTTGSMGDELSYLQAEIEDMILRVRQKTGNAKVRLSVNFYKDHGDEYTVSYHPFTEDVAKCRELLLSEHADGGGDYPEAVDEALVNGICDHGWNSDAVKVMFIILDAPPHDESDRQGTLANLRKAAENARMQGIRIVPVVASGIGDDTEYLMRVLAAVTGGTYVFLTDHSGIGGQHQETHVDQYEVEKLNDLMVKVILSYWDGSTIEEPKQGNGQEQQPDPDPNAGQGGGQGATDPVAPDPDVPVEEAIA